MKSRLVGGAVLSMLLSHAQPGVAGDTHREQGMAAFQRGDYAAALSHFREAEQAGRITPALRYNLGATYYRLGRYSDAEQQFRLIEDDPRWGDLARYNLGLLATLQGDDRKALRHLEHVERTAQREDLRHAARDKRALILGQPGDPTSRDWQLYFSLHSGFDSNAASLADELTASASDAEDYFFEALGYGDRYLSGARGDGLRGYGLVYAQKYWDYDDFDSALYGVGLVRELPVGHFATELGAFVARSEIGSDHLANLVQLRLAGSRQTDLGLWSASYQPGYFDAGTHYGHINGWQHRLELNWRTTLDALTLRGRYRFDLDDRDDLAVGERFYSYSPRRHGLMAEIHWQPAPAWTLNSQIAYTRSDYAGTNRLVDTDGEFKTQSRQADQWEYTLGLLYRLNAQWSLSGRYQYTDNDDRFKLYTYDKRQVSLGVEYAY